MLHMHNSSENQNIISTLIINKEATQLKQYKALVSRVLNALCRKLFVNL